MAEDRDTIEREEFAKEVDRLRRSGALGESGRLLELFDFLASRGNAAPPASQAEIAETVFGQTDTSADDATVRVYIHRLRKRLDDHYDGQDSSEGQPRLTVPAGTYALRLQRAVSPEAALPEPASGRFSRLALRVPLLGAVVAALVLAGAAFWIGHSGGGARAPRPNAIWQPLFDSKRPTLIVLGDYYMFGEIDPVRPEEGRLIRDFRVGSPTDLMRMQELMPDRYGNAEDVGLNYLPFSSAYGLSELAPLLASQGRQVSVLAASQLEPDMLNYFNVVYVGLFSGMHLLEDINFASSGFRIGESYDELIDETARQRYVSEEARSLASPAYYRDYGYISRFRAPSGALIFIVAGARDTGLRGVAPLAVEQALPDEVKKVASGDQFEALFQITGQQGADLSERLVAARARTVER